MDRETVLRNIEDMIKAAETRATSDKQVVANMAEGAILVLQQLHRFVKDLPEQDK